MKIQNCEWRAALAALAAAAGTGFSSGREVVFFFSQMGKASWIGVAFASAAFGALCGIIAHFAKITGAQSFTGVYMKVLDRRQGVIAGGLYGLMMAITAGVMLTSAGKLAMLSLPFRNAFLMGVLLSLGAALLLNLKRMRAMPPAGAAVVVLCAAFHAGLAADARDVTIHLNYQTIPKLYDSVTAAVLLSLLHAALSASAAGGMAACFSGGVRRPMRFAVRCSLLMLVMLSAANAAILRGGERLLAQPLPTVVLAARWGRVGYYAAVFTMWLCAVTTLAAALGAMISQAEEGIQSRRALTAALAFGAVTALAMGVGHFVELGYPMLGWACVFSLAGLACYYEGQGKFALKDDKITC